jgi:hypothetical protein
MWRCPRIGYHYLMTAVNTYFCSSSCEFESPSWQLVLDTTLCDKVCQWLTTGRWFSPGNLISSTNIENWHHYVTEILLNVVINTVIPNLEQDSSLISVRPVVSHWQTLSHIVVSSTSCHEGDSNSQLLEWW